MGSTVTCTPRQAAGAPLRCTIGLRMLIRRIHSLYSPPHMLGRPAKRDETETESVLDV